MANIRAWFSRLAGFLRGRNDDHDLTDELIGHLQAHVDDNLRAGMTDKQARRDALTRLGGVRQTAESYRDRRGLPFLETTMRDLRYALRMMRKAPGFSAAAVAILAVTIGANAAVYTLVDRLLMRPLPYPEAARLGTVARHYERGGSGRDSFLQDGTVWMALRGSVPDLDIAMASGTAGVNLVAGDRATYVQQQRISAGFFRVLGIAPALGREFTSDEDRLTGPSVVMLSDSLWTRTFDADPNIVGRAIRLRGEQFVVVGVMPAGFHSSTPADLWTPLRPSLQGEGSGSNYSLVARLRPGALWADVSRQVEVVGAALVRDHFHPPPDVQMTLRLLPWQQALTATVRQPLLVLWSAVLAVLLIGCVNIAGLLLARSSARAREIATRMALGGGRAAVVRQLLVESLVLASCGAVAGVALGYLLSRSIAARLAAVLALPTSPDLRVLLVASVAALGTSVVFGLFPALHASRADIRGMLTETGGAAIAGPARRWPTRILVMSQVALGIVLVVGAGLLIRTFLHLTQLPPGFDLTNVVAGTLSLQDARYRMADRVNGLFTRSIDRIRELPGVESAAVALSLPYERPLNQGWRFDGEDRRPEAIALTYVTPEYFRTLKIPVLGGRVFDHRDTGASSLVAIVNDAFVRQYSPDRDPVSRRLRLGGATAPPIEIVGVVGAVQQVGSFLTGEPVAALPTAYVPASQVGDFTVSHSFFQPSWIVRTKGPATIVPALQRALHDVDPQLAFNRFRTINDVRGDAMLTARVQASLLTALAAVALALCLVGVYGLVANSVAERRRELGVRMALGATPIQTVRTAAAAGVGLAACGTVVGLLLALLVTRVMRQMVFGLPVNDPLTLFVAAGTVALTASAAAIIPALRTLRLNITAVLNSR